MPHFPVAFTSYNDPIAGDLRKIPQDHLTKLQNLVQWEVY